MKSPLIIKHYQQNQTYRIEKDRPPVKLLTLANVVGTLIKIKGEK